jgi:peroxin-1
LKEHGVDEIQDFPIDVFSRMTEGFRPRDLLKLASRARRLLSQGDDVTSSTTREATERVLQDFTPLARIGLDMIKPKAGLSWNEIGGLFEVKKKLEGALLRPVKYRAIYQQAKIRLPRGFLLVGPTGCGKSCLVPALAHECKFPLIVCKGPEILDKYIGASEAKIRDLFHRAASVAPSILFLDELDALAPRRGSDHTGVTDRVVNQLLTFLDGVEDTSSNTVYVIGASSRPDKIDPALLRPGRLEQHLFVGPPETKEEWIDLVRKVAVGWRLSQECQEYLFSSQGADDIFLQLTSIPFLCPADIKAAMDTAQLNAIHRTLTTQKPEDLEFIEIEVQDLRLSISSLRPCLTQDDARTLAPIYERFQPNSKTIDKHPVSKTELKTTLR